jgi:Lon protease-like protein
MRLPETAGIMVLPQTVLFPHNLLPLHIFEPRYREMLRQALATDRMFAVSLAQRGEEGFIPSPVGGLGLIRACMENPDGTSNLILQGLFRVGFDKFTQSEPYFIGKVHALPEEADDRGQEGSLLSSGIISQIDAICQNHPEPACEIHGFLSGIKNHNLLADIVAGTFLRQVARRQLILETTSTLRRLHLLASSLREEYPST